MKSYQLFINLTSTLDADYFQVELDGGMAFDKSPIDDMPVYRKEWHEVEIKNKPYDYKTSGANRDKLYDLIMDNPPSTTFRIKFISGDETVYGYFGQVDCDVNEDESILKVKPAIVDQYTDFIENYDTKIDVFGEQNLIKNGDFEVWSSGVPDGWAKSPSYTTRDTLLDRTCVNIGRDLILNGFVIQSCGVIQGRQIALSFLYAFIGASEVSSNLKVNVKLNDSSQIYYLNKDGEWVSENTDITYKNNAYPLDKESVEQFEKYSIVSDLMPVSGTVTLTFEYDGNRADSVYLTDVELVSSDINYVDLKISLQNESLEIKPQEEIITITSNHYPWFQTRVKTKEEAPLTDYFNDDGSPNDNLLAYEPHGMHDGALRYPDWEQIFEEDEDSSFYKGEICELTIARGNPYKTFFTEWVNIKGYALFAREEIIKDDEYDESNNLIPPEGDGWVTVDYEVVGKTKWVRKPYNGQYNTWDLGELDTTPGKLMNFDYSQIIKSTKTYPKGENSITVSTAVDFRDICRKIFRATHNSLLDKEVYSAFFWNDSPYLADIIITTGENYVTRENNPLNNIAVVHTSDLKTNVSPMDDEAVLELSFKTFFEDLKIKFPDLIWFMDADKNLHIEHMKFMNVTQEFIDIRDMDYVGFHKQYKFNPEEMYATYEHNEPNSGYRDFKRGKITFEKIVSNKRNKDQRKELTARYISTDIQYAIENPANLENGMILVAHSGGTITYKSGHITKTSVANGDLCISNLLRNYARYEGVWNKGKINDEQVYFPYTRKVRDGSGFTIKDVLEETFFLTDLGIAIPTKITIDYDSETTEITPVYRHYDYFVNAEDDDLIEI